MVGITPNLRGAKSILQMYGTTETQNSAQLKYFVFDGTTISAIFNKNSDFII